MVGKLYYTSPLEAAYMAKEFGVKLRTWELDNGVHPKRWRYWDADDKSLTEDYSKGCCSPEIEVDPDSYHIFDKKIGDVLYLHEDPMSSIFYEDVHILSESTNQNYLKNFTYNIIIQRDNKPFFNPKLKEIQDDK